jgi:co-chaperonin GroES (HSP10)
MLKPQGSRVLVTRITLERPTSGLIFIPDSALDKPSNFAVVLALGAKCVEDLALGDTVLLKDFVGAPYVTKIFPDDANETECIVVNEDDILAVVGSDA